MKCKCGCRILSRDAFCWLEYGTNKCTVRCPKCFEVFDTELEDYE